MSIKKIIKEVLLETDIKVQNLPSMKNREGGSASALARAQHLQSTVEKNLSSLGVYGIQGYMEEQGIFSIDRIKSSGSFKLSFETKEGITYNGSAKYNSTLSKEKNTLALDFTNNDGNSLQLLFSPTSIRRPFMSKSNIFGGYKGDKRALVGLQEDEFFDVKIKFLNDGVSNDNTESEKISQLNLDIEKAHIRYKNDPKMLGIVIQQLERELETIRNKNEVFLINKKLITENYKTGDVITTKIKIKKIGIESTSSNKRTLFSDKEYTKVKGNIQIIDKIEDLWEKVTSEIIQKYLQSGVYYARLSEKDNKNLVLSTEKNKEGEFLVIRSKKNINVKEPSEWENLDVIIDQNPHGNYNWKNKVSAKVISLVPSK